MKEIVIKTIFLLLLWGNAQAQGNPQAQSNPMVGSVSIKRAALLAATNDTSRVRLLLDLCLLEVQTWTDSSIADAQKAYELARRLSDRPGMEWALIYHGLGLRYLANYPKGMDCELKALQLAERINDIKGMEYCYGFLGANAQDQGYYETALLDLLRSIQYGEQLHETYFVTGDWGELALVYAELGLLDSALSSEQRADSMNDRYGYHFPHIPYALAYIYETKHDYPQAIHWYRVSGEYAEKNHFLRDILRSYTAIGRMQMREGNVDSAILYASRVLEDTIHHSIPVALEAANILNEAYEQKRNKDSMVKYLKFTAGLKDTLFGREQARQIQNLSYNETVRQQLLSDAKTKMEALKKKNLLLLWFAASVAILVFIFHRYRIAQLTKLHTMRNNISRDLHDNIGSDLTSIGILCKTAERTMQNGQPELSISTIRKINAYSYEMVEGMSDIVWAINPKNDNIESLRRRLSGAMSATCRAEDISLIFEVDEDTRKRKLSMKAIKNVFLICKEAINNAIKYACCSTITITIRPVGKKTKIMIADNGKGFDPDKTSIGNGLKNMQTRAGELHGTFSIESCSTHTTISIII